jgi:phage-related protein
MTKVYFPDDVKNLIASLGDRQVDVLTDLFLLSRVGPEELESCREAGSGIWEYRRQIGPSWYAYLLFTHHLGTDSYVVLHGFRAGPEGTTRADLRIARRRRKAH